MATAAVAPTTVSASTATDSRSWARISPSSGVEPPPESWRVWLGPDSGAMVQAPSGDAVTTPDCRTTSARAAELRLADVAWEEHHRQ